MNHEIRCLKIKEVAGYVAIVATFCSIVAVIYLYEELYIVLPATWIAVICFVNTFCWIGDTWEQIVEKQEEAERKAQSLFQPNSIWALWARNWGRTGV